MKIETNVPPSALIKTDAAEVKVASSAPKDTTKAARSDGKQPAPVKDKMLQWFARAGIVPSNYSAIEQDIGKRVTRHQFVKAQRKLKNLERILELASNYSFEQSTSEEIDPDWFFSFIELAEDINAPAMQELWGKIYAVEISHPGSFSMKTLHILKSLTHKDAKLFKIAVSLSSRKKGEHGLKIIVGYHQKPSLLSMLRLAKHHQVNIAAHGLAYPDLLSLMDLGLIYSSEIETGELNIDSRSQYRCGPETYYLSPKKRGLSLTYYKLTSTGVELARLIHGKAKSRYLEELFQVLAVDFDLY
ncbi:TIGR03899 family protein [Aliiglaciecola litoralis]|uniref:TIGR03899 family protein n=1 Tax=Aliiglaciecola litoralis TaxID=582857 RepID=A0ABP3WPK7_9ALTE